MTGNGEEGWTMDMGQGMERRGGRWIWDREWRGGVEDGYVTGNGEEGWMMGMGQGMERRGGRWICDRE